MRSPAAARFAAAFGLAAFGLAACSVPEPGDATPQPVASVDLARYAGLWHEVARYPNRFQDTPRVRCADTTAFYTPRAEGRVGVENRCRNALAEPSAPVRVARGTAYAVAGSNNARLRVSFFWPFHGDYWVIGLDPGYRWAVVGSPRRDYLWVLSRTPDMAPADRAAAEAVIRREGFDPARLQPAS